MSGSHRSVMVRRRRGQPPHSANTADQCTVLVQCVERVALLNSSCIRLSDLRHQRASGYRGRIGLRGPRAIHLACRSRWNRERVLLASRQHQQHVADAEEQHEGP